MVNKKLRFISFYLIVFLIFYSNSSCSRTQKKKEIKASQLKSEILEIADNLKKRKKFLESYFRILQKGFKGIKLSNKYKNIQSSIYSILYDFNFSPKEEFRERLNLLKHRSIINSVVLSKDGKILASASDDDTIRLWNPKTGKEIRTFTEGILLM